MKNTNRFILSKKSIAPLLIILIATFAFSCDKQAKSSKSENLAQSSSPATEPSAKAPAEASNDSKNPENDAQPSENAAPDSSDDDLPTAAAALKDVDGAHYSIFSFLSNRPLAHEIDGGRIVANAGKQDFTRYLWGNHAGQWKLNQTIDGRKVIALDKRRDGMLSMPSPVDNPSVLIMQVYNPVDKAKNDLKIKLNGKPLDVKSLKTGWNNVVWKLNGQGSLENIINVEFTGLGRIDGALSGGAISNIELGEGDYDKLTETLKDQDPSKPLTDGYGLSDAQDALTLKADTGAIWNFFNVPGTSLRAVLKGKEGCGVNVALDHTKDGKLANLLKKQIKIKGDSTAVALPIKAGDNEGVRLMLSPIKGCEEVTIDSLDLVANGQKPARKTFEPPKHILVWMIDTLRSDHLPIHFKTDVQAPNLKKLADEGASFKWGIVQGNESKTSHASFFTGMYPNKHRVLEHGTLKPFQELLPEALQKLGYTTAAYMGNGYISKPWGFVQGWDFYRNNLREQLGISAAGLRQDAQDWMGKNADKKFFMYVGTIDPHVTYHAHKGLIEKYVDPNYSGAYKTAMSGETLGKIKAHPEKISEADRKQIEALYKNEIEYNDQEFGKLRQFLEEKGLWDKTMVIILADHGDEFWEHGSVGHGQSAYDELVHVPILIYYPPAIDAGVKPETGADVLDIYPTVIDIAGGKPVKEVQGASLLPYMTKGMVNYPEPGIATKYLSHYALQVGNWSYLLRKGDFDLFDNNTDLHEQTNVAEKHPFETRALTDSVSWFLVAPDKWEKLTWGTPTNLSPNFLKLLNK